MKATVPGLIAIAMLLPQEKKNEAEELFKELETRLSKASTIEVEFTSTFEQERKGRDKVSGSVAGWVRLQEGNLARLEYDGKIVEPLKALIISDGKKTALSRDDPATIPPSETSGTLNRDATLMLARMGGMGTVLEIQKQLMLLAGESGGKSEPRETDPGKTLRLGGFRTGEQAKVDGRDALVIQFEVEETGKPGKASVTLWLDSGTRLPLRRRITDEEKGIRIEEAYRTFKLDGKIDAGTFEHSR